jgi:hypothetical protein
MPAMKICRHEKKERKPGVPPVEQEKSGGRIPPLNLNPQIRRKRRGEITPPSMSPLRITPPSFSDITGRRVGITVTEHRSK